MNSKPPPGKFRIIKCGLKGIVLKQFPLHTLSDAIRRTNQLVSIVSLFIKAFLLFKVKNKEPLPLISRAFIQQAFRVCALKTNLGRKPEGENLIIYNEFLSFFDLHFKLLFPSSNFQLTSAANLSHLLGYAHVGMLTSFETNIKEHFFSHLYHFVNVYFQDDMDLLLKDLKGKSLKDKRKAMMKELHVLKEDLINGTNFSPHKDWLLNFRSKVLPFKQPDITYE